MSNGSRYINIIYCKPYLNLCYGGWMAPLVSLSTVGVAGWRCQYLAVHWGLGLDPRSSTRGTHKLGLTGKTDAGYIFHLNGLN